jgi:type IX secretion system PorP/SprF family membrane protein
MEIFFKSVFFRKLRLFVMRSGIFLFLNIILNTITVTAQDIHFSQFYECSSLLNPALTGVTNNLRATLEYRDQWRSVTVPYKTFCASFEMKFNQKQWEKGGQGNQFHKKLSHNLSWGISVFSDKAGDGNMGLTQVNLSLSSQVPLSEKMSVAAGVQGSFSQRSIDYTKLIWPDQYNGVVYDQNINPNENIAGNNFTYGDLAAGILWKFGKGEMYMSSNDEIKANAGLAVYHIVQPEERFLAGNSEFINLRYVFHGGALFGIKNSNLDIAPTFMINLQGSTKEIVFGTLLKYQLREDSRYTGNIKGMVFSLGGYYRNLDAIIPNVMLEMGQYALSVSYDVNVSELKSASSFRGGIELTLRFIGTNPFLNQNKSRF